MSQGNKKNISTDVAEKISGMILAEQRFRPGDKLPNERDFAEELGVSRTSIREAFKLLHAKGMLEIRRNVGAFVNKTPGLPRDPFGLSQLGDPQALCREWYELRLLLEPDAMPWVVTRADDAQLDALEDLEQTVSLRIGAGEDYWALDLQFHEQLAQLSGNRLLMRVFSGVGHAAAEQVASAFPSKRPEMRAHHEIIRFLRLRDPDGAGLAMRYHLLQDLRLLKEWF